MKIFALSTTSESDLNALLEMQEEEQRTQARSVYGNTRGDEYRSDELLRLSNSI